MQPVVACITLTRDRPQYVARALQCIQNQTVACISVLIDTGQLSAEGWATYHHYVPQYAGKSIGWLRNFAIEQHPEATHIAHFDDDDWSCPERIEEQLAHLRISGKDVTGYGNMLFYDANQDRVLKYDSHRTDYALGTSLLYRREVWERVKFPDQTPEDTTWQNLVGHQNISSISSLSPSPRMIQTIHAGNASAHYTPSAFFDADPEHDRFVRQVLEWGRPLPPLTRREQFGAFVEHFKKAGTGVEVGTQYGLFAKQIMKAWTGTLICVDTWPQQEIYEVASELLIPDRNILMWRGDSIESAAGLQDEGLDWVYIDADHHYQNVLADLEAWFPKVRKGGVVAGHDYVNYQDMGVIQAVNEFAAKRGYFVNLTTKDTPFNGVQFPTWWFIK